MALTEDERRQLDELTAKAAAPEPGPPVTLTVPADVLETVRQLVLVTYQSQQIAPLAAQAFVRAAEEARPAEEAPPAKEAKPDKPEARHGKGM